MLLHDTGKGGVGGQEKAGARSARSACERLGYTRDELRAMTVFDLNPERHADDWAAAGRPNLWGKVPDVVELAAEIDAELRCRIADARAAAVAGESRKAKEGVQRAEKDQGFHFWVSP